MTRLVRRKQFAIAEESTEGTAETLGASDVVFEAEDLATTFENQMNERRPLRASLSPIPMLPGIQRGEITGRVELVGSGGASAPPTARVLKACGLREVPIYTATVSSITGTFRPGEQITDGGSKDCRFVALNGSTLTYADTASNNLADTDSIEGTTSGATATVSASPVPAGFGYMPDSSDDIPSFTCEVNHDGVRHLLYGCRGTATIEAEAGGLAYLSFTLSGAANTPSDGAFYSGVTLPDVDPEAFLSAGLEVDGRSLCVNRLGLDLGNNVAARTCANDANGIIAYRITDRQPTLSIDPEALLENDTGSEFAFYTRYNAATRFSFTATIGQTSSQRLRIIAPEAMFTELPHGDREGILTHDATLALTGDQPEGDDEFIIAFD